MNSTQAENSIRNGLNSENIPFTRDKNKFIVSEKYYDSIKALFMFFIHKEGEELELKVDNEFVTIVFS